ncbi:hypothetical protein SERLA73DRAFT_133198, partial [Serpula lacrymans var. lacrymans S7.3]
MVWTYSQISFDAACAVVSEKIETGRHGFAIGAAIPKAWRARLRKNSDPIVLERRKNKGVS